MRYSLFLAGALVLATANALSAELVEVQLPQLVGTYCSGGTCVSSRSVHFQLDRLPLVIYGARIHISGTVNVGQYECDFGDDMPIGPYPYAMEFLASMRDTVGGHSWMADGGSPEESGEFDLTIPFRELYGWPVTWDFLKAGYGSFEFYGMPPAILVDCQVPDWPEATIDQASLIVEADFEVGVEPSSWGSIKSLFR